jgi:regulator of replication initiation timing
MSYCRWSCDNGYSDAYVYEDVSGGWTTHIANMRFPPNAPKSPLTVLMEAHEADHDQDAIHRLYMEAQKNRDEWNDKKPPVENDHPEAGKSFNHATPKLCAENLIRLSKAGFHIPKHAINALLEESKEEQE